MMEQDLNKDLSHLESSGLSSPARETKQGFRPYKAGTANKTQYAPLNRSNTRTQSSQKGSNKHGDLTHVSLPSSKKVIMKTSKKNTIKNIVKRQAESPISMEQSNMTISAKMQSSMRTNSQMPSSKKSAMNSSPLRYKLQNNAYQTMESGNKNDDSAVEYCWTNQNRQNVKIDLYACKKNLLNWADIDGILKKRFGQKVPRDLRDNMHNLYKGLLPLTAKDSNGTVNKFKYMQLILDQKVQPSEQRRNSGMALPSSRHVNGPSASPVVNHERVNLEHTAKNQDIKEHLNEGIQEQQTPRKVNLRGHTAGPTPLGSFDLNARSKGEQVKMIDLIERRLPSSQESLAFDSSELLTQQQPSRAPTPRYQFESKNHGRESFNRTSSRSRGSQDSPQREAANVNVDKIVEIKPSHERVPSYAGINLKTVNHFTKGQNIALPEKKIKEIYGKMAPNGQTMDKATFNNYMAVLKDEDNMAQQAEIKHKLREVRNLFEQPSASGIVPTSLQQILDRDSPVKSKSPNRKTRLPQLISFDQEASQRAIAHRLIDEIEKVLIKNQLMAYQDNCTSQRNDFNAVVDNSWRTKLTGKIQSVGKQHPLLEYYDTLQKELDDLQKGMRHSQTRKEQASLSWENTPHKQQNLLIKNQITPTSAVTNTVKKGPYAYTPKAMGHPRGSLPVTHEKSKLPKHIDKKNFKTSPKNRLEPSPPKDPVNHNVKKYEERLAKIKAAQQKKLAAKSPSPAKREFRSKTRQMPNHQFKTIDMEQYETEKGYDPSRASRDFCNKSVRPSHGRGTELTENTQTELNQSSSKRLQEKKIKYSIDEMINNQQFIQKIASDDDSSDHTMNLGNYSEAHHNYPKRNQSIEQEAYYKPYHPPKKDLSKLRKTTLPKSGKPRAHLFDNNKEGVAVTKCLPEYGEIQYSRQLNQESRHVPEKAKPIPKVLPNFVKYEQKKLDMINPQPLVTVMHQDVSSEAWGQDITQDRTLENFMRAGTPSKRISFRPQSPSRIQQNRSPREYIQPPQPSDSARRPYTPTPQFESQCHSRFEPEAFSQIQSEYTSQMQDSQINFKQKIQQSKIVEKPAELQEEIVFTELDPQLELISHDTLSVRNPNNISRLSFRAPTFNNNKSVPERLEDIITEQQNLNLSDEKAVQAHLENQGFQMFEQQKLQLSTVQARSYNKNSEDFKNQVEIVNDEKFENDETKDIKLWETHDRFKHVEGGNIEFSMLPLYIKDNLHKIPLRRNAFVIYNIQCGQKMGQKITDVDTRWVEKWYDIQCRSIMPNRPQENLILKYYSKFWTNLLKNTIEGESSLKVYSIDNQLQFELNEQMEMNNIFSTKNPRGVHGEKMMPNDQVSRRLQNKWNNNIIDDSLLFNESVQDNSRANKTNTTPSNSTHQLRKPFKSPMKRAMMQKDKFNSQHTNPFDLRYPKLDMIRTNLSEYDHRGEKVKEYGVEHRWQSESSTVFETATWSKNHFENDIKHNVVLTETNKLNQMTADNEYKTGKREGTNEFGQTWKEDWAVNTITGHQKWKKVYSEPKHLRQDGCSSRWGEWREESPSQNINHGEKWTEISKDGYNERRSEKYTEYSDSTRDPSSIKDPVKKILIIGDGQGIINKISGKSKQPKNGFQVKLLDYEGFEKFYAWEITNKFDQKMFENEAFDGIVWVINSNYDLQQIKKSKEELNGIRQLDCLQKVPLLLFVNGLDKKGRAPEEIANILELRFIHERVWNIKSAAQGVQNAMKWLQQTILNQCTQKASLKRSGVNTFQNSDKKLIVEHWEEFKDGTLIKNIYEDDGKGKKMLEKKGVKLDLELLEDVEMVSDQYGFFKHFKTSTYTLETEIIKSLQALIEGHKEYLEWEYSNQIMEYFGLNKVTTVKKGKDYKNQQEWNCLREYYLGEEAELVTNYGKDAEGEWKEQWHKNKLGESWAKKEGHSSGKQWFEEWYLKVNEKEEMLESKSDKWAKNDVEEWHEKWGESHIPGNKFKWFDKWQINLLNGQRQGEKWSQKYHDDYSVKEHCNEKWDHNGIYESNRY